MELERFHDAVAFLERVGPFLVAREAEHSLLIALAATVAETPGVAHGSYQAAVSDGPTIVSVALDVPPFGLILSEVDRVEALDLLVEDLAIVDLPSVTGPSEHAGAVARRLADRGGRIAALESSQRIFRATAVRAPRPAPGHLRLATVTDRDLLVDWFAAFEREALGAADTDGIEDVVDERMTRGWIHVWDDDGPVSFLAIGGRTPHGVLLEGEYTPPTLRGRGYGRNSVAELSRRSLDAGLRFVFLFTDVANPISNRIYPELGFEPVRDVDVWRFEVTESPGVG